MIKIRFIFYFALCYYSILLYNLFCSAFKEDYKLISFLSIANDKYQISINLLFEKTFYANYLFYDEDFNFKDYKYIFIDNLISKEPPFALFNDKSVFFKQHFSLYTDVMKAHDLIIYTKGMMQYEYDNNTLFIIQDDLLCNELLIIFTNQYIKINDITVNRKYLFDANTVFDAIQNEFCTLSHHKKSYPYKNILDLI